MEKETVKFYFSFRSPYSWLAYNRIEKELAGLPVKLEYLPLVPPPQAMSSERLNPPREKARYIAKDVSRFAEAYGLSLKFPRPFDTDWSKPHGGFLFAQEKGQEFGLKVYGARFSEGKDVGDLGLLDKIALSCGLDQEEFLQSLNESRYHAQMEKCLAEAQTDGIFGVPTFIYRGEMFWGNDRIEWLVKAIERSIKGL